MYVTAHYYFGAVAKNCCMLSMLIGVTEIQIAPSTVFFQQLVFGNFVMGGGDAISSFILLHEKFLQLDWLRAVVFQLNLKYLHVKITNLLRVVV